MRSATCGVIRCLRVVSGPGCKRNLIKAALPDTKSHGPQFRLYSASLTNTHSSFRNTPIKEALPSLFSIRNVSSESPSGSIDSPDTGVKSAQSPSLVSSEGASKSLTGPRITSKKGYLDRENMIRETQKAIRQYYKDGMYQVRMPAVLIHTIHEPIAASNAARPPVLCAKGSRREDFMLVLQQRSVRRHSICFTSYHHKGAQMYTRDDA